VVAAALAVADEDGVAKLSMRAVARRLGVEAMSLYHHVSNKDDLLDGMVDAVHEEFHAPVPGEDWAEQMRLRSRTAREALKRHPWAVGMMDSRRTPGWATLTHHDAALGCLLEAGFSLGLTGHAFALLDAHLYGFLLQELALPFDGGGAELEEAVVPALHPRARAAARLRLRRRVRRRAGAGDRGTGRPVGGRAGVSRYSTTTSTRWNSLQSV
jgi:AcrR family transcriptional regulator